MHQCTNGVFLSDNFLINDSGGLHSKHFSDLSLLYVWDTNIFKIIVGSCKESKTDLRSREDSKQFRCIKNKTGSLGDTEGGINTCNIRIWNYWCILQCFWLLSNNFLSLDILNKFEHQASYECQSSVHIRNNKIKFGLHLKKEIHSFTWILKYYSKYLTFILIDQTFIKMKGKGLKKDNLMMSSSAFGELWWRQAVLGRHQKES